ncbi:MAG: monovalent cation/H+ antiporter complex subunit F [Propionibacteriaceae bacterium]|nr:monovalent cation/H+ antiporter complex subunit F [Propionibacteriaceae bacterium]
MIDGVLTGALAVLAWTMVATLVRVVAGPSARDRLLGVALASTTGVGFLLVAAVRFDQPALRDAALAIVALAVVVVASRLRGERAREESRPLPPERADG